MERGQGKDSSDQVKSPELRRWINVQTIGMSFVLAIPVAMMVADMYGLQQQVPQIGVLLFMIGTVIFAIGHYGRRELRAREDNQ